MCYDASIVIATRNRSEDLARALRSTARQTGVRVEVIVIDDGSTDDSRDMVRNTFPDVNLIAGKKPVGYIALRNAGARIAKAPFIFSIDDDAEFSDPNIIRQTLSEFSSSRIGAVAIPFINPLQSDRVFQCAPEGRTEEIYVTDTYIGTSHALRRDIFLSLGGYREELVHQGEEADYCLRMLDAGYVVRVGAAPPVRHFESPKRDKSRMDYYGRRNDILFAFNNVPALALLPHVIGTTVNGARSTLRAAHRRKMLRGLLDGLVISLFRRKRKHRVSMSTYRLYRKLKKSGPLALGEVEAMMSRFGRA